MRDWGHAKDYIEMQWMMLQQEKPEDFVIATGRQESVRKFIELCGKELGWSDGKSSIIWKGRGIDEIGLRADTKEVVIKVDPRYFRLTEVQTLLGDPSKAKEKLGWQPQTTLEEMVTEMIKFDTEEAEKEIILKEKGFEIFNSLESIPNDEVNLSK